MGLLSCQIWTVCFCVALLISNIESDEIVLRPLDASGLSCNENANEDVFSSNDGCHECVCDGAEMQCTYASCPEVMCQPEMLLMDGDDCCPSCRPGCYDDKIGFIIPGEEIPNDDPCTMCFCAEDGSAEVECVMMDCAVCPGRKTDDGSCCGQCEIMCERDGEFYEIGEDIPSSDPCESCQCIGDDNSAEVMCYMAMCAQCRGKWIDDGSCCGRCKAGCEIGGKLYKKGEDIPSEDRCSSCFCDGAEVLCMMSACAPCMGQYIDDGSCCGKCLPACVHEGELYDIGVEVPSKDPCETCMCNEGRKGDANIMCYPLLCGINCPEGFEHVNDDESCCGHCEEILTPIAMCDPSQCPKVKCPKNMQFQLPGMCCAQCKCKYQGKVVDPGPFGDKCDGCVCNNGKVTCSAPKCPTETLGALECVDAEMGEDCCYHCPNGKTCSYGKGRSSKVIQYGEYAKIKNKICTCAGDPWFPNAFCADRKISKPLLKKYGKQLADYMNL